MSTVTLQAYKSGKTEYWSSRSVFHPFNPLPSIMPTGTTFTPPTQGDTPDPKNTFGFPYVQANQIPTPTQSCHELEPPFPPLTPRTGTPSILLQSTTDHDSDANSAEPQSGDAEDEYTLSAYGDISLGEVIVPPTMHSGCGPLQPRISQPRLRLKVKRPPMPKRRLSYYVPDPMPHSGGLEPDESWPGSPRPIANKSPWIQHQPLVSLLPVDPTSSWTRENKPVKKSGSSLEKLCDELLPHSPSIRLSPPGSPPSQSLGLPQETYEQKSGVRPRRSLLEEEDAPLQDKPRPAPWRTRLPPRLPIPKWDM